MVENSSVEVFEGEPQVYEKKIWNLKNLPIALLVGFVFIVIFVLLMFFFNPVISTALIIALSFIVVYSIVLFFLLEPRLLRQVNQKEIHRHTIDRPIPVEVVRTIERPVEVIKEVPYQVNVPVDREVVREVPGIKEVPRTKTVYIARPNKKIKIPHYDYIGSNIAKTYHKSSCRFGKLIKRKYKVSNNDLNFFKKKGYSPCEVCILKNVKV
jgi:hypothetical protein